MKIDARRIIRIIAIVALIVSLCILAVYITGDMRDAKSDNDIDKLKNNDVKLPDVLDDYAGLYAENSETVGWLKIDGTEIDNVVMYAPDEIDKFAATNLHIYTRQHEFALFAGATAGERFKRVVGVVYGYIFEPYHAIVVHCHITRNICVKDSDFRRVGNEFRTDFSTYRHKMLLLDNKTFIFVAGFQ